MEILKISAIVLISVILISSLPLYNKNISALITISVCIIITGYIIRFAEDAIATASAIAQNYINSDFSIVYKAMGISILTQFVSDTAGDSGNKALSNQMLFAGMAAIAVLAMPVFIQVLEIIRKLTE